VSGDHVCGLVKKPNPRVFLDRCVNAGLGRYLKQVLISNGDILQDDFPIYLNHPFFDESLGNPARADAHPTESLGNPLWLGEVPHITHIDEGV
jgi:hypothetical protein